MDNEQLSGTTQNTWPDLVSTYEALDGTRQWSVEGFLEGNPLVLWVAPEKSGKSWTLIQLAVAVAMGKSWLGRFKCVRPGKVLYLDAEYGQREFTRRVARVARGLDCDERVALSRFLYVNDPSLVLTKPRSGERPSEAKNMRSIAELVRKIQQESGPIGLVVVDPLRDFLDGNENDTDAVLGAAYSLQALRNNTEAPVVVAHHVNKQGAYSGSRGLMGRFDVLVEGTDESPPWFGVRGRTFRHGDQATKGRFTLKIEHTSDENDLVATTRITARFEGEGKNATLSRAAQKVLSVLQSKSEAMTVNQIRLATKSNSQVANRAMSELESLGLVEKDGSGWSLSFTGEFAPSEGG